MNGRIAVHNFASELMEFAIASMLRPFIPIHASILAVRAIQHGNVIDRCCSGGNAFVIQNGAQNAGCELGSQTELSIRLVAKRVHLLHFNALEKCHFGHNVRIGANASAEEFLPFYHRRSALRKWLLLPQTGYVSMRSKPKSSHWLLMTEIN